MSLEEDVDLCQLKKESIKRLKKQDIAAIPENHHSCYRCDGYDFDCPEYTPMENTP